METENVVNDLVNFIGYPEELWGSYGIVLDFRHPSRHMIVEVFINGSPIETIDFAPGALRDSSDRFERGVYTEKPSAKRSPLRDLVAEWIVADEQVTE